MSTTIFLLVFYAWSTHTDTLIENIKDQVKTDVVSLKQSKDSLLMVQTVKGFLSWYKNNYAEANGFGLTYQDKQDFYHVNLTQGEKYLSFLKSSGFISDKYVAIWSKYFKDKAAYMEENLQNDGPPEGFEFDLVLITQEPELVLKEIDKLQFMVSENTGDNAILQITGEYGYDFELVKENGKWMIEYIATMNYD